MSGWGGEMMQEAGMTLLTHYKSMAFMGFLEVLTHLRAISKNFKRCKNDLLAHQPDAVVLTDYPGFNLRIAKFARKRGFRVFYYIAPKAWAWKQSRVYKIKKYVHQLLVIFPFEKAFFEQFGIQVSYVGNPLLDQLNLQISDIEYQNFKKANKLDERPIIALFPGSRNQEIQNMLPLMLKMVPLFKDYQFVIGGAPSQDAFFYQRFTDSQPVKLIFGQGQLLMKYAKAGLITSGTATLEAALFRLPQVICYKGNKLSIAIARKVVKVKYIGLANLILDQPVIRELIQEDLSVEALHHELEGLLFDGSKRKKLFADYQQLAQVMGGPGASEKAARIIIHATHPKK
jgi:lipid-A-disaccharide synthase